MSKQVADILLDRLIDWGVDTIFGLPGDGINGLFEGLRKHQDKLKFIQVRHEEAAAFAAVGYAKYTGRLGVCMGTSGPGGIHLLNGLYDARCDQQPILAITGHTFHDLIGTHYQQDVDLNKLFMDVAVYNERVMGPSHVEVVVDEAIRTAMARRGVAHITIPKDIQEWPAEDKDRSKANIPRHSEDSFTRPYPVPGRAALEKAAAILNESSRVVMMVGSGALGAREEVLQVADLIAAPVVKALLGKAVIPDRHPFAIGGLGLLGTAPAQEAMQECDALLLVGSSFPYMEFLPKPGNAKCVQIDVNATRMGLRYPVDVELVGDAKTTLGALAPLLHHKKKRAFLEDYQDRMKSWFEVMEKRGTRPDVPMKPQVVTYTLNRLLDDDAIVSSDSGTIATWSARYIDMRGEMKFSLSGLLATMANGLPYSIGAAVAYPGRQIVCIVGDGGLSMLMCELATIAKYKLNVKVIVIKNNVLGQIKWEQLVQDANPQFGVELQPIDFAKVAEACGATGFTLERPQDAESILRRALDHQGPVVVQCVVDANEPPLPGKINSKQMMHFAESLAKGEKDRLKIIKTILEDKVREVV